MALGSKILFGDNWLSDFNATLHKNSVYNYAQTTIVCVAIFTDGTALGPLASLLLMVAKGTLIGTTIGGLIGGAVSAATGGSFWEGLENGAFSGAISGTISGGMGSWLSGGGHVALSLGKTMIIGAIADTGASLLSDLGDIIIKGENISFGEVLFNAGFSFVLGGAFSGIGLSLIHI